MADEDRRVPDPVRQQLEETERRLARGVKVVEHQQEHAVPRGARDRVRRAVEHAEAGLGIRGLVSRGVVGERRELWLQGRSGRP